METGCFNHFADKVPRKNMTWSDGNLDFDYGKVLNKSQFARLVCGNCEGVTFEVMITGLYETSSRCNTCGMWYIIHCG